MTKRFDQAFWPLRRRAPSICTSSDLRSPEPWNQQTTKSPLGASTMQEAWQCQCSGVKINSPSRKGSSARKANTAKKQRRIRWSDFIAVRKNYFVSRIVARAICAGIDAKGVEAHTNGMRV